MYACICFVYRVTLEINSVVKNGYFDKVKKILY